jgi:hypothetical protein
VISGAEPLRPDSATVRVCVPISPSVTVSAYASCPTIWSTR